LNFASNANQLHGCVLTDVFFYITHKYSVESRR